VVRVRSFVAAATLAAIVALPLGLIGGSGVRAAEPPGPPNPPGLSATVDGRPIPLADVSSYFCDDFSYPVIRCSRTALLADLRTTLVVLLAGVDYTTIYEHPSYSGAFMHVSQDYNVLAMIGWNDKVSSFKGRNFETGSFHTDWFYNGATWNFCCNTQQWTLGSYDNTFSSIRRT